MPRHARTLEFPLRPAERSAAAVARELLRAIRDGLLSAGDWLPSTRALAVELGCSRTLIVAAYDRLLAAGYLEGVPGSGTRVCTGATEAARAGLAPQVGAGERAAAQTSGRLDQRYGNPRPGRGLGGGAWAGEAACFTGNGEAGRAGPGHGDVVGTSVDLTPGHPDAGLLRTSEWRSAWRRAADAMSSLEPWNTRDLPLAGQLAEHLRTGRGITDARPLLFPGTGPAVGVLRHVVADLPVVMESPCYGAMYTELRKGAGSADFVPVDSDGAVVEYLPKRASLFYTTPAHQYPLGHRMSVQRRRELVEWARSTNSLIVEDDYDGEFRYGVAPLPALRSIPGARDHVAYLGTASKMLSPDLRVAWLDVPPALREQVRSAAVHERLAVPGIVDRALADFIGTGGLRRHLVRAGRVYRERRGVLLDALGEVVDGSRILEGFRIVGVDAGLHVTVELPGRDDGELVRRLDRRGFRVAALSDYPAAESVGAAVSGPHTGLVIGYARADHGQLRAFARTLGQELRSEA